MIQSSQSPFSILRKQALCQRIGLSPAHVYAMLDPKSPSYDPSFPHQIRLGAAAVGWLEHEVQAWLESRVSISRNGVGSNALNNLNHTKEADRDPSNCKNISTS
jgi:prophage regulatory protein